ncbi:MAG: type III-B CRISPR-associated protein Cas10/Cmr2 [Verrucomicrobiae bacterium]|nr:type III-B CRISPR-associated protein Cas10/Cmr2 [Verrucomicrobiae bacterium]
MNYWQEKLAAYLHDPPSKCLDIATHRERSKAAFRQAGFTDTEIGEYLAHADHTAAAADRFPFPKSQAAGLQCAFDGIRNTFLHPLSGARLPFHAEFKAVEEALDGENSVQPVLTAESLSSLKDDDERWRARFFAHWRLWPQRAMEHDYRLGFLPADTRIPDHTIWTHMQVVSALSGCIGADKRWQPAFLKFQLGPVQEFIAAARSTRDLWSGSYLLSWLMAAGLKALSAEVGPDAVVFPNLRNQPLFDLHWRGDLWSKVHIGSASVWESLRCDASERAKRSKQGSHIDNPDLDLLTPNLPNVFLAVVPADRANELGHLVDRTIRDEWHAICQSVWSKVEPSALLNFLPPGLARIDARKRFDDHTQRFLSIAWQALPWPESLSGARALAAQLPAATHANGEKTLLERFDAVVSAARQDMPMDHRDGRFYIGGDAGPKDELANTGLAWALLTAVNGWCLDAVRQTRDFTAWKSGGWNESGVAQTKDGLTGKEEMLFGGTGFSKSVEELPGDWPNLFKHDDPVGAITLVKRVWHTSWLADKWKLQTRRDRFPMPDTRMLADHESFTDAAEDQGESDSNKEGSGRYFAVLALDGDQIGKWVSGEKTPAYRSVLATYGDQDTAAIEYFTRNSNPDGQGMLQDRFARLLDTRRLVSPSYHLQFSECLSNFALYCARPIVEAFDGRLIYAGGDDVVAMLPADTALPCAQALRMAFQGNQVLDADGRPLFSSPVPGFLTSMTLHDGRTHPIPFLVPGPEADCSVGVAIAHFKSPLQDVVREAQRAEKRAKEKRELDRSAVAVTLMKRSGETIQWGCKWESTGLDALAAVINGMNDEVVSAKFPHRIVALVEGYRTDRNKSLGRTRPTDSFEPLVGQILRHDIDTAIDRQRGTKYSPEEAEEIRNRILGYLNSPLLPDAAARIDALIGLCQTAAFAHRTSQD